MGIGVSGFCGEEGVWEAWKEFTDRFGWVGLKEREVMKVGCGTWAAEPSSPIAASAMIGFDGLCFGGLPLRLVGTVVVGGTWTILDDLQDESW